MKIFKCTVCGKKIDLKSTVIYSDEKLLDNYTVCSSCVSSKTEEQLTSKLWQLELNYLGKVDGNE